MTSNLSTLENPEWFLDDHKGHNLKILMPATLPGAYSVVWIWIIPRPHYCDRGHWQLNIDGPIGLDGADSFPRYFMNLDRAKIEAVEFMKWRLLCMHNQLGVFQIPQKEKPPSS